MQPHPSVDFDFGAKISRTSEALAYLYECEHAGPYCSPSWGRSGTRAVICAIVTSFGGHSAAELVNWLRTDTVPSWHDMMPESRVFWTRLWDRARYRIADHLEKKLVGGTV